MKQNTLTNQRLLFLPKHPFSFWEGDLGRNNIKNENLMKEITISFSLHKVTASCVSCSTEFSVQRETNLPLAFGSGRFTPKS